MYELPVPWLTVSRSRMGVCDENRKEKHYHRDDARVTFPSILLCDFSFPPQRERERKIRRSLSFTHCQLVVKNGVILTGGWPNFPFSCPIVCPLLLPYRGFLSRIFLENTTIGRWRFFSWETTFANYWTWWPPKLLDSPCTGSWFWETF